MNQVSGWTGGVADGVSTISFWNAGTTTATSAPRVTFTLARSAS